MENQVKGLFAEQKQLIKTLSTYIQAIDSATQNVPDLIKLNITEVYSDFKANQNKIKTLAENSDSKIDYDSIIELQNNFDQIYVKFILICSKENPLPNNEVKPIIVQSNPSNINLPRLTIKPFSGDFLEWINFKALYESSVHNSNCYSAAQKLQILRSHLTGHALSLIDTIPITDDNYTTAYKLLSDRYNNVRSSANFHYARLANFKPLSTDQETLSEFSSVFRSSVSALKSMELNLEDLLLFKLASNALPNHIRLEFEKQCRTDAIPTLDQLLSFINSLEKSYETSKYDNYDSNQSLMLSKSKTIPAFKPKQSFTRHSNNLLLETRAFEAAKANNNPKSHNFYCVICQSESHNAYTCTDFLLLTVDDRYKQLNQLKLCHNCLGHHLKSACKSTKRCKVCHSAHHNTLLHRYDDASTSKVGLVTAETSGSSPSAAIAAPFSSHANHYLSTQALPQSANVIMDSRPNSGFLSPNTQLLLPSQVPYCYSNMAMNAIPAQVYTASVPTMSTASHSHSVHNASLPTASQVSTPNSSSTPAIVTVQSYQPNSTLSHTPVRPSDDLNSSSVNSFNNLSCKIGNQSVLLGTAMVEVLDCQGMRIKLRAVLDSGSEATIITTQAVQKLGLKLNHTTNQIYGISSSSAQVRGQVQIQLKSSFMSDFHATCDALVVPHIVGNLPSTCLPNSLLEKFSSHHLADPNFIHASKVDLLLGADVYPELILPSADNLIRGTPAALRTVFGLIIFGKIQHNARSNHTHSLITSLDPVHKSLQKFWEIEEVQLPKVIHPDDALCEQLFQTTTRRDETGRYIVSLPFKSNAVPLQSNSKAVLNQYQRLERKIASQPALESKYHDFMHEYINLDHMSIAATSAAYIIPHHCVTKESSSTTKLRTVFNASYSDGSGNSLNSQLLSGPKLQQDICNILISFRTHKFVVCSDIKMMYRQIVIRPEDRIHQHIFYRPCADQPIQEFELNTVTYGLTPSAYLAQRVLLQLTEDEGKPFPQASFAIKHHTYVDDVLTGADSLPEAEDLIRQLNSLFALGGFALRKWSSNEPSLLTSFPQDHLENPLSFTDGSPSIKILGLQWTPKNDNFSYHTVPFNANPTKRALLGYIARMFDPIGLLAPLTFWAKSFIKTLWLENLDWDDNLPLHLSTIWDNFASQLPQISQIQIPRFIGTSSSETHLIGFCDASEKGYSAVLYLRSSCEGQIRVQLLKAKTRVAPVKTMTIPRLELCAALLLSKLYESVIDSLTTFPEIHIHLYSDAQIVLTWLKTPPHRLKIFVSNRIQQILAITPLSLWKHVPTSLNPADVASRGSSPQELINHSLWWAGPPFLLQPIEEWPAVSPIVSTEIPELRQENLVLIQRQTTNYIIERFAKYSSYLRTLRIMAYVLRFIHHTRHKSLMVTSTTLSAPELERAKLTYITLIQNHHFHEDIYLLKSGKPVSHSLQSLTPFIDSVTGVLRAGGRIENSALPINAKQPIILPKKSRFTELLCTHYHELALHAGPRATQSVINQEFWIPGLRSILRWLIHNCNRCHRYGSKPVAPIMSSLPYHRVSHIRPFQAVGLDFAGPFNIKLNSIRNSTSVKGYLCVFVCMSTKAAHLECVSDLTTDAFLAAFDRFISRRGLPSDVFSDNGTNFVGAYNYIQELYDFLDKNRSNIIDRLSSKAIKWHFSPPHAPNFGGLWEAAVKSTKHHLHRVMRNRSLTYEEFATLLARIEAVLNSRPLFEPSPDPNESHLTLTPGHFLIGTSLLQPPEETVNSNISPRTRWILLRQLFQSFWKVWSQHYLHSVIQRYKWNKPQPNFELNQIVIIYGSNTSPAEWPLARITALHPGKDGVVRVVTLRTSEGSYIRPVNKLIPVPTGTDLV